MRNTKPLAIAILVSAFGSILEMYDFVIYAMFASVLGEIFFPAKSTYAALISVFAIFAVGYLSRPLGGIIFGHISDRYGRQKGLILSMLVMGVPIFLIGCLPTYHQIGIMAPVLLLVLRFVTGVSVGGEFPSGIAYLAEQAKPKSRGLITSLLFFGINSGIVLASGVGAVITKSMSNDALLAWGWRLPFWFGGVLAVIGYFVRHKMTESPVFIELQKSTRVEKQPVLAMLAQESRQVSRGFTLISVMAAAISLIFLFMPTFLHTFLQWPLEHVFMLNTLNLFILSCLIPLFGWLSDLTSRNFILSIGAYLFLFLSLPLFDAIHSGGITGSLALITLGIFSAMVVGPMGATLAERFQSQFRTSGIGLSYNLSFGLIGGLAPIAVTYLIHLSKQTLSPAFYLMMTALISLIAIVNLRDFSSRSSKDIDEKLRSLGKSANQ